MTDWFAGFLGMVISWLKAAPFYLWGAKLWVLVVLVVAVLAPTGWATVSKMASLQTEICGTDTACHPYPSADPSATPELDSLALFGLGGAGMASYIVMRLRARR